MKNILIIFTLLFAGQILKAQPYSLDKNLKPFELKLFPFKPKGQEYLSGKANFIKLFQNKDTIYYYCKGISIYSLVHVSVCLKEKGKPIQVSLHKNSWNQSIKSSETDKKGFFY